MLPFDELIATYGPLAILAGTLIEGETVVVLAGFAASQGLIDPAAVVLCAFAGTFLGDQVCFYMGRRHGDHRWVRRLRARRSFVRALRLIERHVTKFIVTLRFVYGLRTASLVALGCSKVPYRKFVVLDGLIAALWACLYAAVGVVFGRAARTFVGDLQAAEHQVLVVLAVIAAVAVAHQFIRRLVRR